MPDSDRSLRWPMTCSVMVGAAAIFLTIVGMPWDEATIEHPLASLLVIAAGMTIPMTGWMLYRGMKANAEHSPDRSALTGCPWHDVKAMLRQVGLRPTRQRMALGWILFGKGDRHLTAEMLYEEATRAKVPVSLATIYNTLHQFTEVGLLRQVAVDGSKAYFDTNVTAHHHFFVEGEDEVFDIPDAEVTVGKTPTPPEGFEIARVDVVVRLRRKS